MSTADEVRKLYDLLQSGALTQTEFDAEKAKVLDVDPLSVEDTPDSEASGRWKLTMFEPSGAERVEWVEGSHSAASLAARAAVEGASGQAAEQSEYGWRSPDGEYAALVELAEPHHASPHTAAVIIPAPPDTRTSHPAPIPLGWEWVLIVAGALVAIGSLLPWSQASTGFVSITRNGFQLGRNLGFSADGLVVLALGVIAALIGLTRLTGRSFPRWVSGSPIVLGAVILWTAITDERGIASTLIGLRSHDPAGVFSVGYGVWLVIAGGAIIAFAGLSGWWTTRRRARGDMSLGKWWFGWGGH